MAANKNIQKETGYSAQELYDKDNMALTSNPPQRNICCLNEECRY